jgi:pyrroline-5-carboxylate reductase
MSSDPDPDLDASSKPYLAKPILSEPGTSAAFAGKTLISICAGIKVSQLASWVTESVTVVRAMPNTPCKVSCSFSLCSNTLAIFLPLSSLAE